MVVEYDLVIIGNGEKAALLAVRAAQLKARVALVTDPNIPDLEHIQTCLGQLLGDRTIWEQPQTAIAIIKQELHLYNRLELLQISGVDVIFGTGQFSDRTSFITSSPTQRQIRARAFAIVADDSPPLRPIMGLNEIDYLTCTQLLQLEQFPQNLAVIGGGVIECIVAQTLCRLGHNVTIFADSSHLLPDLDVEIARILQAQLEVEGVTIYTGTRITAVAKRDSLPDAYRRASKPTSYRTNYQIWAGEHTSNYEQILLLSHHDNWHDRLNLAQAGVALSTDRGEIRRNVKLQTTNHRIYICQQRTDINTILTNTLFLPIARVESQKAPQAISCRMRSAVMHPAGVSVGMTEIDARLKYGRDLYTLQQVSPTVSRTTPEFCKLLCCRNGRIVGAHAVGNNARELMETVAIAMHAKLNVYQLGRKADALSGAIAELTTQLDRQIYNRNLSKQAWLEKWFNWRRQWNI